MEKNWEDVLTQSDISKKKQSFDLPINRGVELNSDVADSNNSIILDQVENGVAIRMAVMYLLSLNKV